MNGDDIVALLKYAGDNRWSYEEDIYNPGHFKDMVVGWMQRQSALAAEDT